jgi:hypothetical protein
MILAGGGCMAALVDTILGIILECAIALCPVDLLGHNYSYIRDEWKINVNAALSLMETRIQLLSALP